MYVYILLLMQKQYIHRLRLDSLERIHLRRFSRLALCFASGSAGILRALSPLYLQRCSPSLKRAVKPELAASKLVGVSIPVLL